MAARMAAEPDYTPQGPWLTRVREAPGDWAAFAVAERQRFADAGLGEIPTWDQLVNRVATGALAAGGIAWGDDGVDPHDHGKPSAATQERLLGIRDDGANVPPPIESLMWWATHDLAAGHERGPIAHGSPPGPNPTNPTTAVPCMACGQPTGDACFVCSRCHGRYHRACATPTTQRNIADPTWLCGACTPDGVTVLPEGGPDRNGSGNRGNGTDGGGRSGSHGSTTTASVQAPPAPTTQTLGATAPPTARQHPTACAPHPQDLLCQPPSDLARRVLAAAPPTTLHIPKSARAAVAAFGLLALTSLAWQLADASPRTDYNVAEVGFAIICQSPARAAYIRDRAQLLSQGRWADAVAAVNRQRGAEASALRKCGGGRKGPNPDYFLQRARKCMQEGAVSRATRSLEAMDLATARTPTAVTGVDLDAVHALFPAEDRPGLHPSVCPPIPDPPADRPVSANTLPRAGPGTAPRHSLPQAPRTAVRMWWERQNRTRNTAGETSPVAHEPSGGEPMADPDSPLLFPGSPDGALPAPDDRLMGPQAEEGLRRATRDPFWPAIAKALARGSRMAAPGPSGLRSEHLGEILGYKPLAGPIAAALTCVIDFYLDGRVPRSSVDNRLFLLPKQNKGGVRPIGARERLTSLASRLAAGPLREELEGTACNLGQLGMSAAGTQRAAARVHDATRKGYHVLSLDVKNAFNAVSRRAVLHALPEHSSARKLVMALYDGPAYYRSAPPGPTIEATAGVVQGDPLAAMLFANCMAQLLARAATRATRLDANAHFTPCPPAGGPPPAPPTTPAASAAAAPYGHWVAFADDVYIMSPSVRGAELFAVSLQQELLDVGLEVAKGRDKTAILRAPDGDDHTHRSPWMEEWVAEVGWLRCLGVPCAGRDGGGGNPTAAGKQAVREQVNLKLAEATRAVTTLCRLEHPQHILTGLRLAGAWSRSEYLLSQVPT